jgi:Ca2+/Na+ antiporter
VLSHAYIHTHTLSLSLNVQRVVVFSCMCMCMCVCVCVCIAYVLCMYVCLFVCLSEREELESTRERESECKTIASRERERVWSREAKSSQEIRFQATSRDNEMCTHPHIHISTHINIQTYTHSVCDYLAFSLAHSLSLSRSFSLSRKTAATTGRRDVGCTGDRTESVLRTAERSECTERKHRQSQYICEWSSPPQIPLYARNPYSPGSRYVSCSLSLSLELLDILCS